MKINIPPQDYKFNWDPFKKVVTATTVVILILIIVENAYWASTPRSSDLDFKVWIQAGEAIRQNRDPFYEYANFSPPIMLPLYELFALVDPQVAYIIWKLIVILLTIGLIFVLASKTKPTFIKFLWIIALPGWWEAIYHGQVWIFFIVTGIGAWFAFQKNKNIVGAVFLGVLVVLKPNFGLWPLFLIVGGYFQIGLIAFIAAILLGSVPVFLYGPTVYFSWLSGSSQALLMDVPTNSSVFGLLNRFGLEGAGTIIAIIVVFLSVILITRKKYDLQGLSFISLMVVLVVSPITWTGYWLPILPFLLSRQWRWPGIIAAGLLVVPAQRIWQYAYSIPFGLQIFGLIYPLGYLLLLLNHNELYSTKTI